jgi:3-deoxy-D-manno-octulosonate 8-phosphate phosphatase (KDO 8-P phosphatase)
MKLCGFRACPADATEEIREISDYVSPFNGGKGAVRDICEHLLKKLGKYDEMLGLYL